MYEQTFRLNLGHDGNNYQAQDEVGKIANTKSTYIPVGWVGGPPSIVRKHGDIFTLSGQQAIHLKSLIDQGQAPHFEVFNIPDVSGLELEVSGLNVTVNWTANPLYSTEVQYRNGFGEWVTLPFVDKEIGEV